LISSSSSKKAPPTQKSAISFGKDAFMKILCLKNANLSIIKIYYRRAPISMIERLAFFKHKINRKSVFSKRNGAFLRGGTFLLELELGEQQQGNPAHSQDIESANEFLNAGRTVPRVQEHTYITRSSGNPSRYYSIDF
jgi:hypothetical protein